MEVGLIGSCTNSSYEDIDTGRINSLTGTRKNLNVKSEFTVTPGSELIRFTVARDGFLEAFEQMGGVVLANACGPVSDNGHDTMLKIYRANSIMTSFNRNFAKRNDGNPKTHGFVASPEIVTAFAIAGTLDFNP